jgi:dTDP-4-amino-4,6-dideoxygalactose transaminase
MGPEVQAFEREFADFVEVRHAIATANGTAAIHLAFLALGLGPGDEIIQPGLNFVAASNMTAAVGAKPVFGDILSLTEPTLDPADVCNRITRRTRAVVAMHYGGYPCRMAELREMCDTHRLVLVEDACHALGARYENAQRQSPSGRMVGAVGDVACFSFFSTKNLAVGEGGMLTTDSDDLAERLRKLRSHGMTTLSWDRHHGHASNYDVVCHGYNYRSDELRAALGRAQLTKLLANNLRRLQHVATYHRGLAGLPGWIVPFARWQGSSAAHLMIVLAPDQNSRERAVDALREAGIQASLHYPCIPEFQAFKSGNQGASLPLSREFAARVITLPLYPGLTSDLIEEICHVLRRMADSTMVAPEPADAI